MAQVGVTVRIRMVEDTATETMEKLKFALENLEQPLLEMGLVWSEHSEDLFRSAPWPPLADSTLERKSRGGFPSDSLVRTGNLIDTITGGQWVASKMGRGFRASLKIPNYGAFHVMGTRFMPVRDFAQLDDQAIDDMAQVLEEWLADAVD